MIVAVPVCEKDADQVLANLDFVHILNRRETIPFTCVVTHDRGFHASLIAAKAGGVFQNVLQNTYEPWSGVKNWPSPQNWAWQQTARFMFDRGQHDASEGARQPWFWWEYDATPIAANWIERIREEQQRGAKDGRPFCGHIVKGMNHMNGVAAYPWDAMRHCPKAMITSSYPFDITFSSECPDKLHDASPLIGHYPRWNGIRLRIEDVGVAKSMQTAGHVIFHGCNDGSLREILSKKRPDRLAKRNGNLSSTIFLTRSTWNKAPDEAQSRWQAMASSAASRGYPYAPYAKCSKDLPPFSEQRSDIECGLFGLRPDARVAHFNPALLAHPDGNLYFLPRRWTRIAGGWTSDFPLFTVDRNTMALAPAKAGAVILPKRQPTEQLEDPRLHFHGNRIYLAYVAWQPGRIYIARQRLSALTLNWAHELTDEFPYGGNGKPYNETVKPHEKNWVWFHRENKLHLLYRYDPHIVVELRGHRSAHEWKVANPARTWAWGEIRGGTPPVLWGNEYITFFHSSVPWKSRQNRYVMGAYAFQAEPPFAPTRMTAEPILCGSDKDTRMHGGPVVIFPCGAVHEAGRWLVAFGVNDEACGWAKISDDSLNAMLQPVVS